MFQESGNLEKFLCISITEHPRTPPSPFKIEINKSYFPLLFNDFYIYLKKMMQKLIPDK